MGATRSLYKAMVIVSSAGLCLLLLSCQPAMPESATLARTITPTATATPEPATVAPTPAYWPTPGLSTLHGTVFDLAALVFEQGRSETCALPCWGGLHVGQSGPDDVQRMFDSYLSFKGRLDFVNDNPVSTFSVGQISSYQLHRIDHSYPIGFSWEFFDQRDEGIGHFGVIAWLDKDTDTLSGMLLSAFTIDHELYRLQLSPERVFRELGEPDQSYVSPGCFQGDQPSCVDLILVYDEGLVFRFDALASKEWNGERDVITYCIGDDQQDIELHRRYSWEPSRREIAIVDPFPEGLNNLSELQSLYVLEPIGFAGMRSFEEVFNVSQHEVYLQVMTEGQACLIHLSPKYRE